MVLDKKTRMKAILSAKKICRLDEASMNKKYREIRKELESKTTSTKRKNFLSEQINILEKHIDNSEDAKYGRTIPELDY